MIGRISNGYNEYDENPKHWKNTKGDLHWLDPFHHPNPNKGVGRNRLQERKMSLSYCKL